MALHLREQIEAALATALTGLSTTANRVYRDRDTDAQPLSADSGELPGLVMREASESGAVSTIGGLGNRVRERLLSIPIEIRVQAASGYGTTLNAIAKEIEVALDGNNTLGGLCKWIEPRGWEKTIDAAGAKPVALGKLSIDLQYYTRKGAPDVAA
jgi:hypothetical protein